MTHWTTSLFICSLFGLVFFVCLLFCLFGFGFTFKFYLGAGEIERTEGRCGGQKDEWDEDSW